MWDELQDHRVPSFSFAIGMKSVFRLSGQVFTDCYLRLVSNQGDDYALMHDWNMTGTDIASAVKSFEKDHLLSR
jgi:hypothetical protein